MQNPHVIKTTRLTNLCHGLKPFLLFELSHCELCRVASAVSGSIQISYTIRYAAILATITLTMNNTEYAICYFMLLDPMSLCLAVTIALGPAVEVIPAAEQVKSMKILGVTWQSDLGMTTYLDQQILSASSACAPLACASLAWSPISSSSRCYHGNNCGAYFIRLSSLVGYVY